MKRAVMRYLELLEKFPVLVESEAGQNARIIVPITWKN